MKFLDNATKKALYSLAKILFIVGLAIAVPRFFANYDKAQLDAEKESQELVLGSERFLHDESCMRFVKDGSFALICDNPHEKCSLINRLAAKKIKPKHLFLAQEKKDTFKKFSYDQDFCCVSFKGFEKHKARFKDLRTIVFDVQGLGIRSDLATYLLKNLMSLAIESDTRLVVVDNPNPLGGRVEGPGRIPLRHGLTNGELARYLNEVEFGGAVLLNVIAMKGWSRGILTTSLYRDGRDVMQEAAIYNFLAPFSCVEQFCVFSGDDIIESAQNIETPILSFAPSQELSEWEWGYLCDLLDGNGVACSRSKEKAMQVGLRLEFINTSDEFDTFGAFLKVMKFFSNRKRFTITFQDGFDDDVGSNSVKGALQNKIPFKSLIAEIESTNKAFCRDVQNYLMYSPRPYFVSMGSIKVSRAG
ncbi:DUF1343 domain-containing protein [Candidatus Babeliales bacterium]|nr:DUF1343 domain-containing protein [Candidatus Babeliales bacterium]